MVHVLQNRSMQNMFDAGPQLLRPNVVQLNPILYSIHTYYTPAARSEMEMVHGRRSRSERNDSESKEQRAAPQDARTIGELRPSVLARLGTADASANTRSSGDGGSQAGASGRSSSRREHRKAR